MTWAPTTAVPALEARDADSQPPGGHACSHELAKLRGRLGAAVRHMQRHPTELDAHRRYVDALREYHVLALEETIRDVLDLVPLTDEQTNHLAALLARGSTGAS